MSTYAGTTLMGSQPVAGRARAMHVCDSGRSFASAPGEWQLDLVDAGTAAAAQAIKPTTHMFVTVPDANRTRRPRGTP